MEGIIVAWTEKAHAVRSFLRNTREQIEEHGSRSTDLGGMLT